MRVRLPPKLTRSQEKALDRKIDEQILEAIKKLKKNLTAMVLWDYHTDPRLRYGKKRLLRKLKSFRKNIRELEEYYEMTSAEDSEFLLKYKLREEVGIDLDEYDDDLFDFEVRVKE